MTLDGDDFRQHLNGGWDGIKVKNLALIDFSSIQTDAINCMQTRGWSQKSNVI